MLYVLYYILLWFALTAQLNVVCLISIIYTNIWPFLINVLHIWHQKSRMYNVANQHKIKCDRWLVTVATSGITRNAWPWLLSTLMHSQTPLGNAAIMVYQTLHRYLTRALAQQAVLLGHRLTLHPLMNHRPLGRENPSGTHQLKVQHINFQSIWPRKDELEANLEEHDIDIVIGTETHLTPSIQTSEFLPEIYNAIRRDHSDGYGGLIVIHKQDLIVSELKSGKDCEFLSVKVQCHGKKSVVLAGVYRRPSCDMTNIENISRHIEEMVEKHRRQPIWIAGDLNLPDIEWEGLTISGHQYLKAINQTFLQTLERTDLEQVVDFPTRLAASGKWAYLDLLITNRPGLLHKCLATPGISDHTSIINAEIDCFA